MPSAVLESHSPACTRGSFMRQQLQGEPALDWTTHWDGHQEPRGLASLSALSPHLLPGGSQLACCQGSAFLPPSPRPGDFQVKTCPIGHSWSYVCWTQAPWPSYIGQSSGPHCVIFSVPPTHLAPFPALPFPTGVPLRGTCKCLRVPWHVPHAIIVPFSRVGQLRLREIRFSC